MGKEIFNGDGMDEPLYVRIIPDDIKFQISPKDVAILLLALDIAIEKAEKYCAPMLKSVRNYILKTAMEQQENEKD